VAISADSQSFEDAFRQADQARYLAKSRGRNYVVAAKGTLALIGLRFKLHR
jgi:hypothetical protein